MGKKKKKDRIWMNKGKSELILGFPSNLIPSFAGVELNHNSKQPLEIANNAQVARWMEPVRRHLGFWQLPESLGISIAYFISDHQRTSLGFLPSPACTFPFFTQKQHKCFMYGYGRYLNMCHMCLYGDF